MWPKDDHIADGFSSANFARNAHPIKLWGCSDLHKFSASERFGWFPLPSTI